ncbi:hypothetical protein WL76_08215 [Burkholderia ubonensis]|nr:hypothetical protein WL76_08215 [Burkholderia ubonensis]KWI18335.1 hypothetical protein WM01_07040 [Burkholderia ubonensis]OJA98742.1 hypothetical protein BGV51_18215 [Burkholderia ubonensis]
MMCMLRLLQMTYYLANELDLKQPDIEPVILEAVRQRAIDVMRQLGRHECAVVSQVLTFEQARFDFIERAMAVLACE